jgi:hypothetical protein
LLISQSLNQLLLLQCQAVVWVWIINYLAIQHTWFAIENTGLTKNGEAFLYSLVALIYFESDIFLML